MNRTRTGSSWLVAFAVISGASGAISADGPVPNPTGAGVLQRVKQQYGNLPLSFEVNQGQAAPAVKFLSRGAGYGLFLTPNGAVLALSRPATSPGEPGDAAVISLRLTGAKSRPTLVGLDELPGKSHYFLGRDPAQWHTHVAQYARVKVRSVYPGIDLIYYGNQRQLEYDFVVAPGADPKKIRLAFEGVGQLAIDTAGQLVLPTAVGGVVQRRPIVYQEIDGKRQPLAGRYVLQGKRQVGFEVARYDRSKPLVIDPVLAYSTYFGSGAGTGIALDSAGNAYFTGSTFGVLATPGAFDTICGAPGTGGVGGCAYSADPSGDCSGVSCGTVYVADAFVTKLDPTGTVVLYSTYLGGGGVDSGQGIAVDSGGHAYVTGSTRSLNFPLQAAYDPFCGCGQFIYDAFVTKLADDGSALEYSTYLGGSAADTGAGIAVDASGQAYVTGTTGSTDFPVTLGAAQGLTGGGDDAFVTKLGAGGTSLAYSTFLGGGGTDSGSEIALSAAGDGSVNAYVTGSTTSTDFPLTSGAYDSSLGGGADAFVAKLNVSGSALDYSTYLGGGGNDYGYGIALDNLASGWNVYLTGSTASADFPTTSGAFTGAFAAKLDLDAGDPLVYSVNPGGTSGNAIAVNSAGSAFVAGANGNDAFVTQMNAAGTAPVFTYGLGSSGADAAYAIAVDGDGDAYVTGQAGAGDFPTTPGVPATSGGNAVFVTKIANDEAAVKLSSAAYTVNEADGAVTITVQRIGSTSGEVSVQVSTGSGTALGGADFTTVTNGTITFADGDGEETREIAITNDATAEAAETFTVTLGNPSPAGGVYLNSPGSAVVTIADNDPGVAFSAAAYSVGEGAGTARIYVNRTGTAGGAFTVQYSTAEGTADEPADFTQTSGTLSFGASDNQKFFDVPISEDTEGEAYETVNLTLSQPTNGAVLVGPFAATLSIIDNDGSSSPAISGLTAVNVAAFSARIVWTTNPAADSQVEYGTTTAYGSMTTLNPALVTSHSVTLTGLSSLTTYHYRVRSRNPPPPAGDGRLAISADGTFTTLDAPPAVVYTVSPSSVVYGVSPSQSITITGAGFVLGATITVGSLAGTTVSGSTASAATPFVFTNGNALRFWWPDNALEPAAYSVTVQNPASAGSYSASLPDAFAVAKPQPTVTSTSPSPVTYGITPSQAGTAGSRRTTSFSRSTIYLALRGPCGCLSARGARG